MKSIITAIFIILTGSMVHAQLDQVAVLNEVIESLKGEVGELDIVPFTTLKEVCDSRYITCDRRGRVIGMDFQFANLNGYIPEEINQLKYLEYINLSFNYLDGRIPDGLTELKKLEELTFDGNFLEGPLPSDIKLLAKKVDISLSQNTFKDVDKRWKKKLNIYNQFNLEGCRSPDSIFLAVDIEDIELGVRDAVVPGKEDPTVVETMPRFPGCEDKDVTDEEKQSCAQMEMLQFIYKNLRYPYEAIKRDIEGMAVVQFVVLKNGDIGGAVVKKDPGGRCGNAALWIVNRMNFICDKWVPGAQDGKAVKVQFTLPVRFKLEG